MTAAARLDARATVELAHAVVADAAAVAGVPFLVLKGLGAQLHGLQDRHRVPADVDVLVPPRGVPVMTAELERRGWCRRPADADDVTFSRHSVTLFRSGWSCDLDVHDRFPGFGTDTDAVFARLWRTRCTLVVAGASVPVPDLPEAVLVQALHCLRSITVPRHAEEYVHLVERTAGDGNPVLPAPTVLDAARALGAVPAARPFLADAFGIELDDWGVPDLRWRLLTAASSPHARRLLAVVEAPWRERLRVVRVALLPPRETLEKRGLGGLDRLGLLAAYARRLWRGMRFLPSAAREARRARDRG
ncbi:nucleotidyltransferase family protein [Curtobacterium sp. MCBD17_028]|uniref:nucleotidyltransferase family protein n=1 Tax=Curtobacterium sp. MCBD17_028 TaxID=2175670 RepID=UPI000DA9CE45|nr:nucleotidyltransferase family protein [Curtobacterium sp. MCBD17_028]PZE27248.1 hypothetical protein DEI86_07065 [Curtobacterium sp. MCBD17_028]